LLDGQVAGEDCHGVRCRPHPDAARFAFGAALLEVAVRIGLIGGFAGTRGCGFEPQCGDAGCDELLINLTAGLRVEVPGSETMVSATRSLNSPRSELGVGVGQLEPPRPRSIEPPGRDHR
jgi:hypothetical protein